MEARAYRFTQKTHYLYYSSIKNPDNLMPGFPIFISNLTFYILGFLTAVTTEVSYPENL